MSLRIPDSYSSSSSLDLPQLFPQAESRTVLSESFSLETLPTIWSDDVPPFPSGHSPPLATVVSLWSRLTLFPATLRRSCKLQNRPSTVHVTAPTAPRLRTMLDERICVKRWTQSIVGIAAPGHVPWGQPSDTSPIRWVPEGSTYSPETFRKTLCSKRALHRQEPPKNIVSNGESKAEPTGHLDSTRDNLVFKREIMLNADGQSRRLSLQVPATSMNPEMVDLMLELRHLSHFFGGGDEEVTRKEPEELGKPNNTLIPPTLIVSNSEISVPILLDSVMDSPLPLATRRGKKVPTPLSLKREVDNNAYPDIPTAFLGTPSAYSPTFEFAKSGSSQSMELGDMIQSLRAQCAAIERSFICDEQPAAKPRDLPSDDIKEAPEEEDDEWAFAATLMATYGDRMDFDPDTLPESEGPKFHAQSLPSRVMLHTNSSTDTASDSAANMSDESPDTSLESIEVCHPSVDISSPEVPQKDPVSQLMPAISRPSTPHPLRSALATPSLVQPGQGFLKRRKSVRFASLPSRLTTAGTTKLSANSPRISASAPTTPGLRRPSPLRHSLAPENNACGARGTPRVSPSVKTAGKVVYSNGRKPIPLQMTHDLLIPSADKRPGTDTFPSRRPTTQHGTAADGKPPSQMTSLRRPSLGKLMGTTPKRGKENKAGPIAHQHSSGWSTLDENALRRETETGKIDFPTMPGTRKSRMPIPLRNILTRFK